MITAERRPASYSRSIANSESTSIDNPSFNKLSRTSPNDFSSISAQPIANADPQSSASRFEQLLATSNLPPPGPSFYHARRRLWLDPGRGSAPTPRQSPPLHQKVAKVLCQPKVIYDDKAWKNGIEKVWKNLCEGAKLKEALPMNLIIKIVHAAWIRDQTWPAELPSQAPDPDDELPEEPVPLAMPSGITQPYTQSTRQM